MKEKQTNGTIEKNYQPGRKFERWNELLNAATEIVVAASDQEATATLHARRNVGEAEVFVYCTPEFRLSELEGARFTEKKITSREFYSDVLHEVLRLRLLEFYFKLS